MTSDVSKLSRNIISAADCGGGSRFIVAISGAPGAGKSTLAKNLFDAISSELSSSSVVIMPMDGYHFDNIILDRLSLRHKKGAIQTFDANGFVEALKRIQSCRDDVFVPSFDRELDVARAGAIEINRKHKIIITEGNYLLIDQPPWKNIKEYSDLTISVDVPFSVLEHRLIQRWIHHGISPEKARQRARENDLVNARFVIGNSSKPDIVFGNNV
tara:strand:- start:1376 stop:2017 length:642 start_codon:yes stop_codon:yes gene_type:complete